MLSQLSKIAPDLATLHIFNRSKLYYSRNLKVVALLCLSSGLALPDTFLASFEPSGVQAPAATTFYETFNNLSIGNHDGYTSSFNGSSLTGIYSGNFNINSANVYGGANGTKFATTNSSYSLTLSSPVNYFGIWFSALDAGDTLEFYTGSTLTYSFTPTGFLNLVGSCPGSNFCGNPNNGGDRGEQFAFLNFYDATGVFDRIVFSESISSYGFESDNHAVATLMGPPGGTVIDPTPEPASFGITALCMCLFLCLKVQGKLNHSRSNP